MDIQSILKIDDELKKKELEKESNASLQEQDRLNISGMKESQNEHIVFGEDEQGILIQSEEKLENILEKKINVKKPKKKASQKKQVSLEDQIDKAYLWAYKSKQHAYQNTNGPAFTQDYEDLSWNQKYKRKKKAEKKKVWAKEVNTFSKIHEVEKADPKVQIDAPKTNKEMEAELKRFMGVKLSDFRFKNDEEFSKNLEQNYTLVRNLDQMQRYVDLYSQANPIMENSKIDLEGLAKQIAFLREVRDWMDARRALMAHSYYVLLSSKETEDYDRIIEGLKGKLGAVADENGQINNGGKAVKKAQKEFDKIREFLELYKKERSCSFKRRKLREEGDAYRDQFRQQTDAIGTQDFSKAKQARREVLRQRDEEKRKKEEERQKRLFEEAQKRKAEEEAQAKRKTLAVWKDGAMRAATGKQENPKLFKKPKYLDLNEAYSKIEELQKLDLSRLRMRTVDDILMNMESNNALFALADEAEGYLAQGVRLGLVSLTQNEVILCRAKLSVLREAKEKQIRVLEKLNYGDENLEKAGVKPESWAFENDLLILDPGSVLDKHRIALQKQHEAYSDKVKEFWKALNPNKKLNEDDLNTLKYHFQANVLFWDSIRHTKEDLAQEDRLTKLYIDQYCKKNNISAEEKERVQNDPALMSYLQGMGGKAIEASLDAAFGSEEKREGLRLLIHDEAMNAIKESASFFTLEKDNEAGFLNGIAAKMRAVNLMQQSGSFLEETLKKNNVPLDEVPEVKEARAAQKFNQEILKDRMDRLITLSDPARVDYLAGISFQDIQGLKENHLMHKSRLEQYKGKEKGQIQAIFDELNALQISAPEIKTSKNTVKTELRLDSDMNALYQLYRKEEGADTEAFEKERAKNQQLITTIEGMSHNPFAVSHDEIQDLRLLCLSVLTERAVGISEDRYYDLSTESLKRLTLNCLKNNWKAPQLEEALKSSSKAEGKEAPADREAEWTVKEKDAVDLMAEVSEKEIDENSLLQILLGHVELIADTAAENARDITLVKKKVGELKKVEKPSEEQQKELYRLMEIEKNLTAEKKRPQRKDSLSTIKNKLNTPEKKLLKAIQETASVVAEYLRDRSETKELTADGVKKLLSKKDKGLLSLLKDHAAKIDQEVTASFDGIQEEVKAATGAIYEMKDNITGLFDDGEKEKPTMEERLNSKWTEAYGEGRFVQIVLNNYFTKSGQKEKRRMMSSILRHSKPALKNTAKSSLKLKRAGRYISGMVKGAGPLLQKLMQSLPEEVLTKELREMVEDVKSNLEPIPKDYVDKKLKEMVAASNDAVSEITVVSSLGAASVGQTFLCNIKGKNIPEGTQVVVKLLRPDMEEKIKAEKDVMLSCTEPEVMKTVEYREWETGKDGKQHLVRKKEKVLDKDNSMMDGGAMKETYLGMLDKISEELDLRIEAENCEKGSIYDTSDGVGTVESVKTFKLIPASKDYMLQTKAEGQTLDKLLKDIKNTRREVTKLAGIYEKGQDGKLYYRGMLNTTNMEQVKAGRKRLVKLLKETKAKYRHLAQMGRVWAEKSLFGDKGFFHGDMHAGNIMVSSDKATVLDFGNASELDKTQSTIKLMSIAATCNQSGDFLRWFTDLLPKDSRSKKLLTDKKNTAFRLKVQKEILDTFEECGSAVGEKIYLSMMVLQKHGIEIPQTMFYFSQSELRLQNSIGEMKREIIRLKKDIQTLDHLNVRITDCSADAVLLTQSSLNNSRNIKADYQSAISSLSVPDRQAFLKELKDQKPGASEAFRKKYLTGADHIAQIQHGQKFDDELYSDYNIDELDKESEEVKELMDQYRLKPMDADPSELRAEFLEIQKKIKSPEMPEAEKKKLRDGFTNKMIDQFSTNKVLSPFGDTAQFVLKIIDAFETGDVGKLDIILNAMSRVPDMVKLSDDTTRLEELKKKAAAETDAEKKKELERDIDTLAEQIADLYLDVQNMITDQNVTISMVKAKLSEGINFFAAANPTEIENNMKTFLAFRKGGEAKDFSSEKLDELSKEWEPLYKKDKDQPLTGEEKKHYDELSAAMNKEVTRCMRLLNYWRGVKEFTKELTPWFSDPDGGAELKRVYEDFRSIQQKYVQVYIDEGKEDEGVKASLEYAERQFLAKYKPMAVKRLKSHAEMFEEDPAEVNDVKDFMQILGDVTSEKKTSLMGTLMGNGIIKYGKIQSGLLPETDRAELDEALSKLK